MSPDLRRRLRTALEAVRARVAYTSARLSILRATRYTGPREPEVLVRGYFGVGNLGDELLLEVLRRRFAARGLRVVAASLDPERTRREHGIEAIPRGTSPSDAVALIPRLQQCRLLLLGPGGILQSYGPPSRSLLAYALHAEAAERCGTPVALLGVGAGPLPPAARRVARRIVRRASATLLRDEESRILVAPDRSREDGVEVAPDLAFLLEPGHGSARRPTGRESAIDVGLAPIRLRNAAPSFAPADAARWRDEVCRGIAAFLPASARVRPAVLHETEDAEELAAMAPALAAHGLLLDPTPPATFEGMRAWLEACGVVVVTRFHALVLAILAARPAVTLSYHPKVHALALAAGLEEWTIPMNELTSLRLTRNLESASTRAGEIAERMEAFAGVCRADAGAAFERALDRLLTGRSA